MGVDGHSPKNSGIILLVPVSDTFILICHNMVNMLHRSDYVRVNIFFGGCNTPRHMEIKKNWALLSLGPGKKKQSWEIACVSLINFGKKCCRKKAI